jgi:NAD(P)-dependent dehydrogenase (short-subunit alcohol dehydrogenase family)
MMEMPARSASSYRLDERVAVVTGAGGGIGSAIVDRLVELCARVALLDLPMAMPDLAERARRLPTKCIAVACDIGDEASVIAAASQVKDELGGCDVLVNNAAFLAPNSSLQDLAVQVWERTMTVNLQGAFLCTRSFGMQMLERGRGSIVNVGSVAAHKPSASPSYSVSKAAMLALTRHTAVEWGPRGVRTNSVSPGFVRTSLSEALYADSEQMQRRIDLVPLRRLALPSDIANAVAFLASDAAAFINGQDLLVDGGFLETPLMHSQPKADQYGGCGR